MTQWRKDEVVESYPRSSGETERSYETRLTVVLESGCSTDNKIKLFFASSSGSSGSKVFERGDGKTQRVPTEWVNGSALARPAAARAGA